MSWAESANAVVTVHPIHGTLLDDTVNVTFRLKKLTRSVGASVVASGEFLTGWNEGRRFFRTPGEHALKGRDKAIEVHGLMEREI